MHKLKFAILFHLLYLAARLILPFPWVSVRDPPSASAVRRKRKRTQQQRHVVVLALVDAKHDDGFREEGLALTKVRLRLKRQPPLRRAPNALERLPQRRVLDKRALPELDASIGVCDGLVEAARVQLCLLAIDLLGPFEAHLDVGGRAAGGGVEDVAGDEVLFRRHGGRIVCARESKELGIQKRVYLEEESL